MKAPVSYTTIHPGAVLDQELKDRGIAQKDFASTIGMPSPVLNAIIKQKRSVTPDIAVLLEAALGKDAAFWLGLQAQRDIEEAKMKEEFLRKQQDIETWVSIRDYCNVNSLEKFIPGGLGQTIQDKINAVLSFFGVNSVNDLRKKFLEDFDPAYFRKSDKLREDPISLFTWKYMAFSASEQLEKPGHYFRKDSLDAVKEGLKTILYENEDTCVRVAGLLAEYGIKFVILPNQRGTHVDGFSFWKGTYPTITLTLRGQRLDILAFTLLHEVCHVYNHLDKTNQKKTCISIDGEKTSREEQEADAFARAQLIPPKDWQFFKAANSHTNPYAMGSRIREFAEEHGIHPSIVLGRYQYDFQVFDNGRGIERSIN